MACKAELIVSVTLTFLSFSRSSIGGTTISRYRPYFPMSPFARLSRHWAATMTQLIFASLCTRNANALESSPNSGASLIRGVALRRVKRSSRTSFRSFHFDDVRLAYSLEGRFGVILTSSANCRGSGGARSVPYHSHSLYYYIRLLTHLLQQRHRRPLYRHLQWLHSALHLSLVAVSYVPVSECPSLVLPSPCRPRLPLTLLPEPA